MYAANAGRDEAVRQLVERGADSNAKDRQSSTPLMFAAQGGRAQMVQALLDSGADPNIRGTHGLTALGFAQQNGHSETAQILLDAGATQVPTNCSLRWAEVKGEVTRQRQGERGRPSVRSRLQLAARPQRTLPPAS
jgi:ankyrin repeat protein